MLLGQLANGKYLCVDPSGDKAVLSTSTTIGGLWETFHMETVNGEGIVPDGTVLAVVHIEMHFQKLKQRAQMTLMEQLIMIHT